MKQSRLTDHLKTGPIFHTKLDRVIQKKNIFINSNVLNGLGLPIIQKPDKFVRFMNGPVFGCPVPAEIDHLNTYQFSPVLGLSLTLVK
jgi:hypothetical protein